MMARQQDQAVPVKCDHCERPMSTPLVCDYCHAVNPVAAVADYYTLLDLPRRHDLDEDELHRKYIALSRHAHPDFHAAEGQEVQQLHLTVSAALNDAYRTLKDPVSRGEYLLELLGGKSSAVDKSVPEGFLDTMMMMQEELAGARETGDAYEVTRLGEVLQTQLDGLTRRLAELFAQHQQAVICEAIRGEMLGEIRQQLNAISYVRKLLSQT